VKVASPVFGRSKSDVPQPSASASAEAERAVGKGRPTPTRKEAEAAARARAKVPRTRKEQAAAERLARSESSQKVRAGMKAGDERYLLPRDQGPVRHFVRDYVDTRWSVIELAIPLLLVAIVLQYAVNPGVSASFMLAVVLVLLVEMLLLRGRVRREVRTRFPDAALKGLTYYALSRASQLRFMRLPKAQLKRGDALPERYQK
jgi:hypothetical protein